MAKYFPLEFLDHVSTELGIIGKDTDEAQLDLIRAFMGENVPDTLPMTEIIDFVLSSDFMNPYYCGIYEPINHFFMANPDFIKGCFGESVDDMLKQGLSPVTELRDIFTTSYFPLEWSKNKQVYKPDGEFADALVDTDKIKMSLDTFKNLPWKLFYVDLDNTNQYPYRGAWVDVRFERREELKTTFVHLSFLNITDEKVLYSSYFTLNYPDADGDGSNSQVIKEKDFNQRTFKLSESEIMKDLDTAEGYDKKKKETESLAEKMPDNYINKLIMQLIVYISSDKPDIEENSLTKSTYRPSSRIKNKFSEIRQWDVGVVYGKAITKAREEVITHNVDMKDSESAEHKIHKSPRPHMRCAHWQRYHVGEGRTKTITNWIAPVFVCGNGKEIPVVIHAVK